jgi:pSer/pThr/pTyr-binding forkhead associated (FHA) protein
MRDGRTRKLASQAEGDGFASHCERWRAAIVVVEGGEAGAEFDLDRERITLGRGPGVELAFADDAMSRQHAALEFADGSFRIRDLGSMNGLRLNGAQVQAADLAHGDRFQLGEHVFRFLLEERRREPRTWVLPEA